MNKNGLDGLLHAFGLQLDRYLPPAPRKFFSMYFHNHTVPNVQMRHTCISESMLLEKQKDRGRLWYGAEKWQAEAVPQSCYLGKKAPSRVVSYI